MMVKTYKIGIIFIVFFDNKLTSFWKPLELTSIH